MVLIIDNYDSFTYNLYQQIASMGWEVVVKENDQITLSDIEKLAPSHIIISPGPKSPSSSGISSSVIENFYTTIPILGVCLGHQCIGEVFGSKTVKAPLVVHGKVSLINHSGTGIFTGINSPISVARYHSLIIDKLPPGFSLTAWTEDNLIMGIEHNGYPLFGVQFHPESFMTSEGDLIMRNFLACKI